MNENYPFLTRTWIVRCTVCTWDTAFPIGRLGAFWESTDRSRTLKIPCGLQSMSVKWIADRSMDWSANYLNRKYSSYQAGNSLKFRLQRSAMLFRFIFHQFFRLIHSERVLITRYPCVCAYRNPPHRRQI